MKIIREIIYQCFLTLGTSLILICSLSSCKDDIDYSIVVEFQFVNETKNTIEFEVFSDFTDKIRLNPQDSSELVRVYADGSSRNPNTETCCKGILDDTFGSSGKFYLINDTECVTHDDEKSDVIGNYQSQVISDRVFRYTYTFTEEDFSERRNCQ